MVPVDSFNFHYSKESLGVFLLSLIKANRRLLCEVLCLLNFTPYFTWVNRPHKYIWRRSPSTNKLLQLFSENINLSECFTGGAEHVVALGVYCKGFMNFCSNVEQWNGQRWPSNAHKERAGAIAAAFGALSVVFPSLWDLLEPTEPEKVPTGPENRKEAYVENSIWLRCLRALGKSTGSGRYRNLEDVQIR